MRLMRKRDPQLAEDGFGTLLPHTALYADDLIAEFEAERDDRGLRRWLLELIAESRAPQALPIFVRELSSEDESLRDWAADGLRNLDTKEAREALYRAKANGQL